LLELHAMTRAGALAFARQQLALAGVDGAERLMLGVCGLSSAQLWAFPERELEAAQWQRLQQAVLRRTQGEPVAYILGEQGFHGLELKVNDKVLIPRAETELLVDLALERIAPGAACRVIDLGTGSGAIALSIARERSAAEVWAIDQSEAALQVASGNAQRLDLQRVRLLHSDWWSAVPADLQFDLVVSNPPYVADGDVHLLQGDLRHEPRMALTPGADAEAAYRSILAGVQGRLAGGAWVLFEHGQEQGAALRGLLDACGWFGVAETHRDLEGRERVTLAQALPVPPQAQD
jgi:release factor glutamine methyltransferase